MKIVCWNVNGIRATVKKGFFEAFNEFDADIFCMQETKAQDDQVQEALAELDGRYHMVINSAVKKGYSGTCIISKQAPIKFTTDIGIDEHDQEGRVTHAEFEDFHFVNVYVPNSGSGLKRLDYRETWDRAFGDYLENLMETKPLIVTGDFNVAHQPIDLTRDKANYNKTSGYTQREIDGFDYILNKGLKDSFREIYPEEEKYTYWNQRFKARERGVGWRIDYFLVDERIWDNVTDAHIYDQVFGSDHCPIGLEIQF